MDVSAGEPVHGLFERQVAFSGHRMRPFLLASGMTTALAFDALFEQMQQEIRSASFCSICYLRCVAGIKRSADQL